MSSVNHEPIVPSRLQEAHLPPATGGGVFLAMRGMNLAQPSMQFGIF
jgi:hypothetical protein